MNLLRFKVVLDANVLYSAPVRDLLFNLADQELYTPKWSPIIQDEWTRSLIKNRPDLKYEKLEPTVKLMNEAFPTATVDNSPELIEQIKLPDPDDRHVLATAISCHANSIVTFNIKDFPAKKIQRQYQVEILHPDKFVLKLSNIALSLTKQAFENQLASLKNPPSSKGKLLMILKRAGFKNAIQVFE